jgi:Flp pilus assembly protein TadD
MSGDLRGLTAEQRSMFYAQSWLITHYFFSTPERQAALARYMAAIRAGQHGEALQRATGMTPEAFQDELRRYIGGGTIRYRRMTRSQVRPDVPMTIHRLPVSANSLILLEAALRVGQREEYAPQVLQAVRSAAARLGDDPYARRVLAHAETRHGDLAVADRLLNALLAASPNDAELLYLRGMRHLRAAEESDDGDAQLRQARAWFGRAHRVDANHFQSLYRYAQAMRGEPDYVSENTSNILLLAHQLAPQVEEIGMNAAVMLMYRGQCESAAGMLAPYAADPHDAGLADAAKQMLERAQSDDCRSRARANAPRPARPNPQSPN